MSLFPEFENLPEEMKEATRKLHAAVKRERKAIEQRKAWGEELERAQAERYQAEQSYGGVSLRWNPETNKMNPALEDAPVSAG